MDLEIDTTVKGTDQDNQDAHDLVGFGHNQSLESRFNGVVLLFAETVLNPILNVSTITLTISYGLPLAVVLLIGREKHPIDGSSSWGI